MRLTQNVRPTDFQSAMHKHQTLAAASYVQECLTKEYGSSPEDIELYEFFAGKKELFEDDDKRRRFAVDKLVEYQSAIATAFFQMVDNVMLGFDENAEGS